MQVSITSLPVLWLSLSLFSTTALSAGGYPALMPRRGFTVDTVHNEKHVPNGVAAKAKAMAKFAHLADSAIVKVLDEPDPCELYRLFCCNGCHYELELTICWQPVSSLVLLSSMTASGSAP